MKPRRFPFSAILSPDIGVDLGTSRTLICLPREGIVLDEATLVAVEHGSRSVLHRGQAYGDLAKIMHGRTPESIQTIRPVRGGVVADHDYCAAMFETFLNKSRARRWGLRPRVLLCVLNGITPVERHATISTALCAGAGQAFLMAKSLAAALGAGLPLAEPVASMICDFGAGNTEIAILCLGDVAIGESLRVAGDQFDLAIVDHLRRQHRLRIGEQMAERIKIEIGTVATLERELFLEVAGRDVVTGLPRKLTLSSEEIRDVLQVPLRVIADAVQRMLECCPPELAADLMDNGMLLAGGGAQLLGLDRQMAEATGMPVRVADDPRTCVARGLAICLEHLELWQGLAA